MTIEQFLVFVVLALCIYRVTELFVYDTGPFDIFVRLRTWTGMYNYDEWGIAYERASRFQKLIGGGLSCPYCFGVWLSFGVAGVWTVLEFEKTRSLDEVVLGVVLWFGLAGLQSFLETIGGRATA